jgi:hypothetical protein
MNAVTDRRAVLGAVLAGGAIGEDADRVLST